MHGRIITYKEVYHIRFTMQPFRLERHASMDLDAEHRFLLETCLVGGDNFPNGLAGCGIIRMNEAQDIGGLANHFSRDRSPLAGCLPDRESIGETRGDYFAKKLPPSFRHDMTGRHFCSEIHQFLHREAFIALA